jgi:hypothetical protein|nr:MAG TPA: Avd-like-generating retroelement protein [Caudoviricetes sp.]
MAVKAGERNVPDTPQNRQLNAVWYARELAVYTIQICKNKKVFLPEYQSALTDDIIRTAKDIYINAWTANNIRVTEKNKKELWLWRSKLQRQAILDCNNLLALIGLAHQLFHLKGKRIEYWSEQTLKVRNYIKKWRESDVDRYS